MTPLMNSSTPGVVKSMSRYALRVSSVDSTPIESRRFLIVPVLSSAARIPLPSATSARAVFSSSSIADLLLALIVSEQRLYPGEFLRRGRDDPPAADPPRRVNLAPVMRGVPHAWPDDGNPRTGVGDRHDRPILR